jgi:hypothetical protein
VVAFPAVIAIDPDKAPLGRNASFFHDDGRRPDANHNLRKRGRGEKGESEQYCESKLFHETNPPDFWLTLEAICVPGQLNN